MTPSSQTNILCIETSTRICSVAVICDDTVGALVESHIKYRHGEWLTIAISQALEAAIVKQDELDAISITLGPGSYTGLRIGLATAKAMCMALNIPLIGHSALEVLAYGIYETGNSGEYIVPMMDARRMEVYAAVFNKSMERLREDAPLILDEQTSDELERTYTSMAIGGDGAIKSKNLWRNKNTIRYAVPEISARFQLIPARKKYIEKTFQDVAYVAPIYLKKPNITKPRRTLKR